MDLRRLELFLAVMEHSSVTKAAEKLHVSPGAVSLQLRNLAAELHCDLFIKSGRRLVPTSAAIHLAERSKTLMDQVRAIEQEFENDEMVDSRPFHFATGATTLIHRLAKPLRMLRKRFPKLQLQIMVSVTEDMVAGLFDRRYDLALITLPFPTAGLRVLPLYEEELLIVKPSVKAIRAWRVQPIQPKDLNSASFVLHSKRSNMRTIIDEGFRAIGVQPRVVMEAEDVEVMRRLVESGFACSILPESGLRRPPRYFEVFRIPGHKLLRRQVLAMPLLARPRTLSNSLAEFLHAAITSKTGSA